MNTKLITIEATKSGAKNYIIDGLVLQGYGAVIADTSASGGAHNVYVQNCVMNNGYSYDCEMLRFWNRGRRQYLRKKALLLELLYYRPEEPVPVFRPCQQPSVEGFFLSELPGPARLQSNTLRGGLLF